VSTPQPRQQNECVTFWRGFRQPARYGALLSGALLVLAFPALNLEFLAWFGLVPGLALMRAAPTRREAAARGWWFGAGYLLAAMYWLIPNIGPALLLVAIVLGFLWTAVGLAVWATLRPPVSWRRAAAAFVLVPSAWLVTEWIRSWQGIGGPWALLGASQWQHPVILALAALGGAWLITAAIVAVNTGVLIAIVADRLALRLAAAAAAAAVLAAGPVAFAMTAAAPLDKTITVALVQPGLTGPNGPAGTVAANERLTAGSARHADLVIWAESSVGYYLGKYPRLLAGIEKESGSVGAQILLNQDARNKAGAQSKQALLVGPTGIKGSYIKTRLVPFGEYIPFRSVLGWLTKISKAAKYSILPGSGAQVLHATLRDGSPLTIGVLICFESAFPDMSRVDTSHGAQLIIYQTSDSTFQQSWAPAQHASLGALRAAETGRPVVQSALTGDSSAFDDRGRQLAWAGTSFRGVLHVRVSLPVASARTLYDRLGDYVPWTAVGIAGLAAAIGLARMASGRRNRPQGPVRPAEATGILLASNRESGRSTAKADHSHQAASADGKDQGSDAAAASSAEP
jgi:apolipoprotein N-acyltransferase